MSRKPAIPSKADQDASSGGVAAVDRALSLLSVFQSEAPQLTLTEIADRTQLYKSTALRLLASLEHANLVRRGEDGRYALGGEVARLHSVFMTSFSLEAYVTPVLRELVAATSESAAFHVQQGDRRLCLYRVDSPRPVRDHMKVGDLLPLDRGAGGRILTAFSGAAGKGNAKIRRERVVACVGDRVPELAGVSSPVFAADGALRGAVTLTMPSERLEPRFSAMVLAAAGRLTESMGGQFPTGADS